MNAKNGTLSFGVFTTCIVFSEKRLKTFILLCKWHLLVFLQTIVHLPRKCHTLLLVFYKPLLDLNLVIFAKTCFFFLLSTFFLQLQLKLLHIKFYLKHGKYLPLKCSDFENKSKTYLHSPGLSHLPWTGWHPGLQTAENKLYKYLFSILVKYLPKSQVAPFQPSIHSLSPFESQI